MIKDYEVVDGEHGIIREIKERKYNYPRTLFTCSLAEAIKELSDEFTKEIEEYMNMNIKDYMARKKEEEKRARKKRSKNKRRVNKRTVNSKS